MPISEYITRREYIVAARSFDDLDSLYSDIETLGKSPAGVELERNVTCVHRRPTSRNTHYLLTDWEAGQLATDPRIKSVTLAPNYLGVRAGTFGETQTSTAWDKSNGTGSTMKNWGLLRCTSENQISNWGGTGYEGNGTGTPARTATISLSQTGRNVDVVVCDSNGIVWNHPEFNSQADGSGVNRAIQYNWFQHNSEVYPSNPVSNYAYGVGDHSTHVAGTVAGNTQGWARDANVYNLYYDTGNPGDFSYVFDYIRAFHRNKSVNPDTGRKNPTIVNNSWGMSIFPSEWSFSDITAVTYRGTRYTPSGDVAYTGFSGVCTSNTRLAELINFENGGNRITTTGPYVPPGGSILSKPVSWTQEGQDAYLTNFAAPDAQYILTVQGPADINFISNVAADSVAGTMSVQVEVVIKQGSTVINTYTGTLDSTVNGGTVESIIEQNSLNLPDTAIYTIEFNTLLDTAGAGEDLTVATAMRLTVISESTAAAATVSSISGSLLGSASLTALTTPTVGNNDDGFWTLNLPFNITYLGTTYSTIYVSTNHYLTFGAGSTVYSGISASTPNLPKIMWGSSDNSVQRIYYGVEGVAPNRTYRVRVEGNASTVGVLGNPRMVNEYVFYEATPAQIDLQVGATNRKTIGGGFTTQQLNAWGFIAGQRIPARVAACDVDLEDVYAEGIVMVGAAGNGRWKHDVPGGLDWNNTFEMSIRYPDSVATPYYYMRGTSPTANDNSLNGQFELPAICVGSIDSIQIDQKVQYSDCGPGVDIWAPGTYIVSSLPSGTVDPRSNSYYIGKYSGTSMASPQVCGVLACALEVYSDMDQYQAKEYILSYAKANKLTASTGGPTDDQDLQGAANLMLFYYREKELSGNTLPKINYKPRPVDGAVFPRPRIRRTS
jgi:hypothetical protein